MVCQLSQKLSPGKVSRKIHCESHGSLNDVAFKLSFAVVSRGRILSRYTIHDFDGMLKSWSICVTPEMPPLARLIAYDFGKDERVVALLTAFCGKLRTNFQLRLKFLMQSHNKRTNEKQEKMPGKQHVFQIKAPQGTHLAAECGPKCLPFERWDFLKVLRNSTFDMAQVEGKTTKISSRTLVLF